MVPSGESMYGAPCKCAICWVASDVLLSGCNLNYLLICASVRHRDQGGIQGARCRFWLILLCLRCGFLRDKVPRNVCVVPEWEWALDWFSLLSVWTWFSMLVGAWIMCVFVTVPFVPCECELVSLCAIWCAYFWCTITMVPSDESMYGVLLQVRHLLSCVRCVLVRVQFEVFAYMRIRAPSW